MQDSLERIENKIDEQTRTLSEIKVLVAVHAEKLVQASKRYDSLDGQLDDLREEIAPVKRHVAMVSGAIKLLAIIATLAAIGEGLSVTAEFLAKTIHG